MSAPAEATQFWHLVTRPEEPPKATDMMASIADGKRRAARLSDLISPALAGFLLAGAARTLGEPLVDPTFANASRLANRLTRHVQEKWANEINAAGIEIVCLKGFANAYSLYPDPDLRCFGDLDILVRHADLERLIGFLRGHGFQFAGLPARPWGFQSDASYPPFVSPDGACNLDIHIRPDAYPAWRSLTSDRVFAAAREVGGASGAFSLPSPEHRFLLCVTNAAKDKFGPFAVRKMIDAMQGMRHPDGPDWDSILRLADEGGFRPAVRTLLALLMGLGLRPETLPCGAPPAALSTPPSGGAFVRLLAAHLDLVLEQPAPMEALRREFLLCWPPRVAVRLNLRRLGGLLRLNRRTSP